MKVLLVPGTHAWDGEKVDWYSPSSPFVAYLASIGVQLLDAQRPFVWSTSLGGVGFGRGDLLGWKASGLNLLAYYVPPLCPDRRVPAGEVVIISHSHGIQPVLFAAEAGLQVDTFISVAGPVRKDMEATARAARRNIRRWVHIHAGGRDRWQWFGELFDGHLGIVREHPLADHNVAVPKADHGDVLRDPQYFGIVGRELLAEAAGV